MFVKAFIVNVNKCLIPFFLDQHINIINTVTLQSFWFICNKRYSSDPGHMNKVASTHNYG